MATNPPYPPTTHATVDLTGLPESVARSIRQLVQALKAEHGGGEAAPPVSGENPEPLAGETAPAFISRPNPTPEERERLLDELSSVPTGKVLPPDFSRADIYDDHD